jgi:hypothetical protein
MKYVGFNLNSSPSEVNSILYLSYLEQVYK